MIAILTYAFELLILALLKLFGIEEMPTAVVVALMSISVFTYPSSVSDKPYTKIVVNALFCGLLLRIFFIFFDIYGAHILVLPGSGADSVVFFAGASRYARGGEGMRGLYSEVMGTFFKCFGISRISGQFFNCMCSMVALTYVAKMLEMLKIDIPTRKKVMWILCLLPNFAIMSIVFLRESIMIMFLTISLYEYLRWFAQKGNIHFLLAMVYVFMAALFHSGTIAVAVGYMLSLLLYDNKNKKIKITAQSIALTCIFVLIAAFVLSRSGDTFLGKFSKVESIEDVGYSNDRGGSSYAKYVGNSNSIANFVIYAIPRIVFFLFSPMPWMLRGINDIITLCFNSVFYIYVLFKAIGYLKNEDKPDKTLVFLLLVCCIGTAFVFAWGTINAGTALRHRDKIFTIWIVILALVERKGFESVADIDSAKLPK